MASFRVRWRVALLLVMLGPLPIRGQENGAAAQLRLRPGDGIRLEVRDEPDLAGEYVVDQTGNVLLPLVGLVPVAGRDFEQVRSDVVAGYSRELAEPVLRVTPLIRIAVVGEVRVPGLYSVDPTYSLGDLVALAGGLTPQAARDRITVVRDGVSARSQDPAGLEPLRSGDQVVVERQGWLRENTAALVGAGTSLLVAVITALLLR